MIVSSFLIKVGNNAGLTFMSEGQGTISCKPRPTMVLDPAEDLRAGITIGTIARLGDNVEQDENFSGSILAPHADCMQSTSSAC